MILLALLACLDGPDLEVVAADDLGPLETTASISGRDGGYSGIVGGQSAWVYGDTILATAGVDGSSWRHNTWSWTGDRDARNGITGFDDVVDDLGAPVPLFEETEAEAAYNTAHSGDDCLDPCGAREVLWPGPVVEDPERERSLVFYVKIHGQPGEWNFYALGTGVATWSDPERSPTRHVVRPEAPEPTTLFDPPGFASAALIDDGWLYVYGCEGAFAKRCRVARVDPADVLDPTAWTFWDGEGWAAEEQDAVGVFDGHTMATVHYSPFLERFVAVYSEPLGDGVRVRTAPRPEGPWSREVTAFTALAGNDGAAPYSGLAHPEFSEASGRFETITYFRGTGDWAGEVRTVRLELARD